MKRKLVSRFRFSQPRSMNGEKANAFNAGAIKVAVRALHVLEDTSRLLCTNFFDPLIQRLVPSESGRRWQGRKRANINLLPQLFYSRVLRLFFVLFFPRQRAFDKTSRRRLLREEGFLCYTALKETTARRTDIQTAYFVESILIFVYINLYIASKRL